MRVRALDDNHDWTFGRGQNDYKSGKLAQQQVIQTNLLMFVNDCFFALQNGIDWFNLLGGKNILALNLAQRATLLQAPGVLAITDSTFSLDGNREYFSSYKVNTISGLVDSSDLVQALNAILTEDGETLITEDGDPIRTEQIQE